MNFLAVKGMLKIFYDWSYPVISIIILQVGQFFHQTENTMKIIIFCLQITIGVLTIYKIYKEIKKKRKEK